MRILAIEASGMVASCAVADENAIIGEFTINNKKTHSQTLLPMVDELLKRLEMKVSDMDAFAISKGPGSFTGLRIGSATVKGFALALDKPVVEVPTLQALAADIAQTEKLICPLIDARNENVFAGIYSYKNEFAKIKDDVSGDAGTGTEFQNVIPESIEPDMALDIRTVCGKLNGYGREVIFLGDGAKVYRSIIEEEMKTKYCFAGNNNLMPRAASCAFLAVRYYNEGHIIKGDLHAPEYLKKSQAERNLGKQP